MSPRNRSTDPSSGLTRREILLGGSGVALGAFATAAGVTALDVGTHSTTASTSSPAQATFQGDRVIDWTGPHQAGITTAPQGFLTLMAFDLAAHVDRLRLGRLLKIWTEGISRLTAGQGGLTDTEPELAQYPAGLTITVGLGPGAFTKTAMEEQRPQWLQQLPAYDIDELQDRWSEGDLVLQVCGEDPSTVAHAARFLAKDAKAFATVRWVQHGHRNAAGQTPPGMTFRNPFGQLDGSSNLQEEEDSLVFLGTESPSWLNGGSTMIVRRIHMNLDTWDELDRPGREVVIGRTLDTGAPLTGGDEFSDPELDAVNELGFPVIDTAAHIRRSRTDDPTQRFLRRPYTYEGEPTLVPSDTGLIFITFQRDIEHQYKPVQERLAQLDLLNQWTTPIGSAVFAIPRGITAEEFAAGGFLASELFSGLDL